MTGHRERLIKEGLYRPLVPHDITTRDEILQRAKNGAKIKDKPLFCVVRVDGSFNQLFHPDEKYRCQDAELIAEKLYGHEAQRLVGTLNSKDDQNPRSANGLWDLGLYRVCNAEDWEAWMAEHSQLMLDI